MKNTYIPPGVSPEEALVAKRAAHLAVKRPFKVTAINKKL
jgi:hypothetical protein